MKESELFDNDEFKMNKADGEGASEAPKSESPIDEQQLRIESLKIATKISKLFDNVQPSDIIEMSDKVYNFIQHQNNSGEYDETFGLEDDEEPEDTEDFEFTEDETPKEETGETKDDETSDDEKKPEETSEEGDLNPEDIFDFTVAD